MCCVFSGLPSIWWIVAPCWWSVLPMCPLYGASSSIVLFFML